MKHLVQSLTAGLLALALFALPLTALPDGPDKKLPGANPNIRFGMPSQATDDPTNRKDFLITRSQYVVSYNDEKHIPNWVSWRVVKEHLGKADRGPFLIDRLLPKGFTRVKSDDYNRSGFDRGHMCPSADRAANEKDNDATFVMTNIVPQAPNCNQKAWERLESYCRELVKKGKELHIAAGPYGTGGFGKSGFATSIGSGKVQVHVPSRVWKAILVLPRKGAEPSRTTRTIAVLMPNNQEVDYDWTKWRVAVKDVEKLTGHTFWPNLDAEVAEGIKAAPDDTPIDVPVPKLKKKKKKKGGE